jgi:hypothetical protein
MRLAVLIFLVACGGTEQVAPLVDSAPATDMPVEPPDAPAGFGTLSGMCGVIAESDLTSSTASVIRDRFTFERAYVDPDDRPLLTAGGRKLAETPNAGGSSGLSEVFAFEQLDRCEQATLLKTETEIVYDVQGKITDLEIMLDGHKIGVSVVRAVTFPFGSPYTADAATAVLNKKLEGIAESTANVSDADRWTKQFLAVLAWDDQAADVIVETWDGLDAGLKGDTILVVTATDGEDVFIYSNN